MPFETDSAGQGDDPLIDEFGTSISGVMGWPPMAGRAAGVLMMSKEPLTLSELQESLGASKGSVSETTRLLITNGTVERFKAPGSRQFAYRWREDAWVGCLEHQVHQAAQLLEVAQGMADRSGEMAEEQRRRVDDMHAYYTFIVQRLEAVFLEYKASREGDPPTHP